MSIIGATIILGTLHLTPQFNQAHELNDFNPGAMLHFSQIATGCEPTIGTYHNSYKRTSFMAGCKWSTSMTEAVRVSAVAGALTGYADKAIPFAAPAVSVGMLTMTWLPNPSMVGGKSGRTGINFSININLE